MVKALLRRRGLDTVGAPVGETSETRSSPVRALPGARRLRAAIGLPALGALVRPWPGRLARSVARQAPAVAAGLAASVPVIVSTVNAVRAGWEPDGDDGIILTRALDVFSGHTPLIGQFSEAGNVTGQIVHSPGPMLYWLLAIPVRLGGPASAAIAMGAVDTLCVIGCVALARRRGGLVLMLAVSIGIALLCQSLYAEIFHDVWNPSAAMFPFLLLIFLGWSVAAGDYKLLPALVVVASFVTQTHLTYLAPTLAVVAVAVGGLTATRLIDRWSARGRGIALPKRVVWRWIVVATVALGICWSAPIVDELEHSPGNLSLIVTTVHDRGKTLGPRSGWYAVVRAIGVKPWFLFVPTSEWNRKFSVRETPSGAQIGSAMLLLAALALIAVAGTLRRRVDLCAAALIGLGMCLGLGADAANTPASPLLAGTLGYTMWWGSQLGFWVWLVVFWSLYCSLRWLCRIALPRLRALAGRAAPQLRPRAKIVATVLATAVGVAATGGIGAAVANGERPDSHVREYAPTTAIGRALVAAIPPGQTIDYRVGALDLATQPIEPAIRFWLVKHGDRPLANGSLPRLGSYYELYHRPHAWTVYLADGAGRRPHMRLVARVRFDSQWGRETLSAWVARSGAQRSERRRAGAVRRRPVR